MYKFLILLRLFSFRHAYTTGRLCSRNSYIRWLGCPQLWRQFSWRTCCSLRCTMVEKGLLLFIKKILCNNHPIKLNISWNHIPPEIGFLYKFKERDLPIYIWYDNYPSHIAKEYVNRVDRVDSLDQRYGLASLNLTKVTEKDRGWYNCKVLFLDRGPDASVVSTMSWMQ